MRTILLVGLALSFVACGREDPSGADPGAAAGTACEWPGDECASGSCREWLRVCQASPDEACTLELGCGAAGDGRYGCVDGTCRPRGTGATGAPCTDGGDCDSGRCEAGVCVVPCTPGVTAPVCAGAAWDDEGCRACDAALRAAVPDAPVHCWSETEDCWAPELACMPGFCPWAFCEWWARVEATFPDGLPEECR